MAGIASVSGYCTVLRGIRRIAGGLDGVITRLTRLAFYAGQGMVLLMMLVTTADVGMRWLRGRPISGALELSEFMLAVFSILGLAFVQASGANVRVTVLETRLPVRLQALLATLYNLLALGVMGLLSWQAWMMGQDEMRFGTVSDSLKIPVYPFLFLLAVGTAILALQLLRNVIVFAGNLIKGRKQEDPAK